MTHVHGAGFVLVTAGTHEDVHEGEVAAAARGLLLRSLTVTESLEPVQEAHLLYNLLPPTQLSQPRKHTHKKLPNITHRTLPVLQQIMSHVFKGEMLTVC
jgi:hypothetical protein